MRPQPGDLLVRENDASLKPITPEDVPLSSMQLLAWSMDPADKTVRSGSRLNRLMLQRFDEANLAPDTTARAAAGVVAYTAICTHTGCDAWEWQPAASVLKCSCHFSEFALADGARVLNGPAPRRLPALPLTIVDGALVVADGFVGRPGFESSG